MSLPLFVVVPRGDCVKQTVRWTVCSTKREKICLCNFRSGTDSCRTPDPLIASRLSLMLKIALQFVSLFHLVFPFPKNFTSLLFLGSPTLLSVTNLKNKGIPTFKFGGPSGARVPALLIKRCNQNLFFGAFLSY